LTATVELDLGLVVAGHGRHCMVEPPEGRRLICHPRGKKSEVVVGDRVRWQATGAGSGEGVIEHIEPRRNLLFRQDDWKTKSFAANLDGLMLWFAVDPVFSESQLVRALIASHGRDSEFAARVGADWKGKIPLVIYAAGIALAGTAGRMKEHDLSKQAGQGEFSLMKGLLLSLLIFMAWTILAIARRRGAILKNNQP
jgi:hypothetical protein